MDSLGHFWGEDGLRRHYAPISDYARASGNLLAILLFCGLLLVGLPVSQWTRTPRPPSLWDPVPFVFNTVHFLTDNHGFMKRVSNALKNVNLVKFRMGSMPVYLVSGPRNIQAVFGRSLAGKIGNEDIMVQRVFPILYMMTKEEVQRFANDKTGRGNFPSNDHSNDSPRTRRYWAEYEHVHSEFLSRPEHLNPLVEVFQRLLSQSLARQYGHNSGQWTVSDLCRRTVVDCAHGTLLGPGVSNLNEGFLDAFWKFDDNIFQLTLGFPHWLNPGPYRVRAKYLAMIARYLQSAWAGFDWEAPGARETPWEPCFGARVSREIAAWVREAGFRDEVAAGALGMLLFAQNSNSIPTVMWMLIEIARDKSLQQAIREEVATAHIADAKSDGVTLDSSKLVKLPLLQSVFTETLRLHMHFNVIRHVRQDGVVLDLHRTSAPSSKTRKDKSGSGIGTIVSIPRNSMLQVPMMTAHLDETVWGTPGYPASQFWAERHVKYSDHHVATDDIAGGKKKKKRVFSMAARPSSFFPFGGGETICPGRHFAKHEVLTAVGLIVSLFEFENAGWIEADGSISGRPGHNDTRYCGAGAMPPDRDMKISWNRIA